ncbi:MAG: photosynthetic protein synthase I [Alphaproteobacteria bacterium]|nr:photosynthetic protein synthase I [Alphaproteobacteria bacterium]
MTISRSKRGLALTLGAVLLAGTALAGSDQLGPIAAPEVNEAKALLGQRLFFDKRLSGDTALSCSSCHQPDKGFADGLALSKAYPGSKGFRNTPTLINTALADNWFHDGRIGTNLNDVTREMITEDYLMNMDMRLMQERVKQDPVYVEMFKAAGYGEPSNGSIRKAIPEYLATLTSRGSPFDEGTMSEGAKRGQALFEGKAGCSVCHSGSRLTDDQAYNIGVPENPDIWSDPMRHMTYAAFAQFMGIENYMNIRRDVGAQIIRNPVDRSDVGTFNTPTLRELTYTAPYMHNGMFSSLFEVVAFYNAGGGDDVNKDARIKPLGLSFAEQKELVDFLESLSGDPLTGPEFVWQEPISTNYPAIENWRDVQN